MPRWRITNSSLSIPTHTTVTSGLPSGLMVLRWANGPVARSSQDCGICILDLRNYVGRYTHRGAISNHRIVDIEDGQVKFNWRDYRDNNQQKTMTLSAEEFIRRFLLHVLPRGFHRIRYYGFLGNRYRKEKLQHCRQLLNMTPPNESSSQPQPREDYRDRYERLTGHSLRECPVCHRGRMMVVKLLAGVRSPPTIQDTS